MEPGDDSPGNPAELRADALAILPGQEHLRAVKGNGNQSRRKKKNVVESRPEQ